MTLKHDPWLSDVLGKPSYHLQRSDAEPELPRGEAFVDGKVPVDDVAAAIRLQRAGFRVVDTNVQLERDAAPLAGIGDARFARPQDADAVRALASQAFVQSRFYLDPMIPRERASRLKAEWAGNFFAGKRGEWMVVADAPDGVAGFLQLLRDAEGRVVIDLIAVAPAHRGRGVARAMIAFAAHRCLGTPATMRVGTQIANLGSLALYEALGFRITSASYVLHLHQGAGSA